MSDAANTHDATKTHDATNTHAAANDLVLFDEITCADGLRIGMATLNVPKTLNGLSLDMTRMLATRMERWAGDPDLALIILRGSGGRAFCAGGDLHTLYQNMTQNTGHALGADSYPGVFFSEEYTLDYRIHTFPKPIMVWGDGIVMGGGMGLMMGASHRVVTETTRMAMPEISIGLFPDVGGSWLLNRLPGKTGLFLGLTGAQIGAADALYAGMADYHLMHDDWDRLVASLKDQTWERGVPGAPEGSLEQNAVRLANDDRLHGLLAALSCDPSPTVGVLEQHLSVIQKLCAGSDLEKIVARILALADSPDPWLQRAARTLAAGSPGSVRLTFALLEHCKHVSLAEVYRIELVAGLAAASHGDFAEGIRALLVDKDKQPKWNPPTLALATARWVEKFFIAPFPPEKHPLGKLGESA